MPTYAPFPRDYRKKLVIPATAEVLCYAKSNDGGGPDEAIRVPASAFGGGGGGGVTSINGETGVVTGYMKLAGTQTATGAKRFDSEIAARGGLNLSGDGVFGPKLLAFTGGNGFSVVSQNGSATYIDFDSGQFGRIPSGFLGLGTGGPTLPGSDIAFARAAPAVVEINDGSIGGVGQLQLNDANGFFVRLFLDPAVPGSVFYEDSDAVIRRVVSTGDGPFTITVPGIDLKAVAVTDLFTVPAGKRYVLLDTILRITAANTISNGLVSQVIENGGPTNISSATTAINTATVNTVGEIYVFPRFPAASASLVSVAAGNKVQFNVTTGMTATAATGEVAIVGFLVDA